MDKKRSYRMRERAKSQEETRLKIVEATMHLHEEIGARATTISAIAERSGVQRLTVYRHFPDETAVFQACTAHWLSLNPPPDPQSWVDIADPWERLRVGLAAIYDYFSRTTGMWTPAYRDVDYVPALQPPMAEFGAYLEGVGSGLVAGFENEPVEGHIATTIHHALQFLTWSDLEGRGLNNSEKVELVTHWLCPPSSS